MKLSPGQLLDMQCQQQELCQHYGWTSLEEAASTSDLALALFIAYSSKETSLGPFGSNNLHITAKPDMTPVSEADYATETLVRDILHRFRPEDKVLGEEFGGAYSPTGRQWIIDPIDGTKNYIRNIPVWATLIALYDNDIPRVSVISAPAMNRIWWASKGNGSYTFRENTPHKLSVSTVSHFSDCSLAMSSLHYWNDYKPAIIEFMDEIWRIRGYGDFLIYCFLAEGSVDLAVEPEVSVWDLAAPALLVEEAGGCFSDFKGHQGPHGGSAIAGNRELHPAFVQRINQSLHTS